MARTPWAELTPEERERERQQRKLRKYMKDTGRPPEVPADEAMARVRLLHDEGGLSFRTMSRATGDDPIHPGTLSDLYRGTRAGGRANEVVKSVRRRTRDLIMAIPVPVGGPLPSLAIVGGVGTRRRLQALACAGYGAQAIANLTGRDHKQTWRDMTGGKNQKHKDVTVMTRELYRELYPKYIHVDPADLGVSETSILRAKAMAKRHEYAPDSCWDGDTIENPDAIPEWTGACGTVHGRTIHMREDIPMCQACREAYTKHRRERG
jgi:hypothetical protein